MKVIYKFKCAWCGKTIKPDLVVEDFSRKGPNEVLTSHGLCEQACYERWLKRQDEKFTWKSTDIVKGG